MTRTSLGQSNMKPGDLFIISNTFFRSIALKKPEKIIDVISDIKATLHSGQSQLELLVKETYKEFTEEKLTWKDLQTHEEKIRPIITEQRRGSGHGMSKPGSSSLAQSTLSSGTPAPEGSSSASSPGAPSPPRTFRGGRPATPW